MYAASWLSPLMTAPLDTSGLLHCKAPEVIMHDAWSLLRPPPPHWYPNATRCKLSVQWGNLIAANTSAHPYVQARGVWVLPLPCVDVALLSLAGAALQLPSVVQLHADALGRE